MQQYMRTTAISNNINIENKGVRGPLNLDFANQFKCTGRKKFNVFVLKVRSH